jgi:pyruvate dehydrogenase E2 component (dihydrolipoamide acetyltransferase)
MATNVILPALGMAQDSGKILEWLKAEGEQVNQGEPIVVIETDKASVELEAPASGVLARVTAAGSEVPVAEVIALILAPGESASDSQAPAGSGARAVTDGPHSIASGVEPSTDGRSRVAHPPIEAPAPIDGRRRRLASPKARRVAAELGVNLAALRGTGPGGVVLAGDVQARQR